MTQTNSVSIESIIKNLNDEINNLSANISKQIDKISENISALRSDLVKSSVDHDGRIRFLEGEMDKMRDFKHSSSGIIKTNAARLEQIHDRIESRKKMFSDASSKIIASVVGTIIIAILILLYENITVERKMLTEQFRADAGKKELSKKA